MLNLFIKIILVINFDSLVNFSHFFLLNFSFIKLTFLVYQEMNNIILLYVGLWGMGTENIKYAINIQKTSSVSDLFCYLKWRHNGDADCQEAKTQNTEIFEATRERSSKHGKTNCRLLLSKSYKSFNLHYMS